MLAYEIEDLLRREAPQVLGALVRRHGQFHLAEEAVQEALFEASRQWPAAGVPDRPRGWLVRVAQRRLVDSLRSESSRREREDRVAREAVGPDPAGRLPDQDDSLQLLLLCCHEAVSPASAVALTLRAVGGLTTEEIAAAFLVPAATMGQRISRAKAAIADAGARFEVPEGDDLATRLGSVLTVLYLMFNEGYASSGGDVLTRVDLSGEAIRLTRLVVAEHPRHAEAAGLLALELLAEARRPARERDGMPIPLDQQDRGCWDAELIAEGCALAEAAIRLGPLGRFQLQAAIAAVHCSAATAEDTDWRQVLALHVLLARYDDSPMATVSRAVAVARVEGPPAGLALLDGLVDDPRLKRSHRLDAVRAHLLRDSGDRRAAATAFRAAARATRSVPERRYLLAQAALLADDGAYAGPPSVHDEGE